MKMKICDAIRKADNNLLARIIGAVVVMQMTGSSAEDALTISYDSTLEMLETAEIEVDYKPTNADRIRAMSDKELADFLDLIVSRNYIQMKFTETIYWLRSEVEG